MKNNKYLNLFIIVSVILLILYSIYYIFIITMENIKKIIKKIIKENYSNKYQDLENFVIDSIDFDEEVSRDEKLKTGLERFEEEYGFMTLTS